MNKLFVSLALLLGFYSSAFAMAPATSGLSGPSATIASQLQEATFKASDEIVASLAPKSDSPAKTAVSAATLAGDYLDERYYPATTLVGMYKITIAQGASSSDITISNLLGGGKTINATINADAGTVSIAPGQVVGVLDDGSQLKAYYVDLAKSTYYTNVPITGTISTTGVITMGSWIAVASGPTTGQMVTAKDLNYKFNATATHTSILGSKEVTTNPVHVSMSSTSQMIIKNLCNTGYGTEASLDSLGNLTIVRKVLGYGPNTSGNAVALYNNCVSAFDEAAGTYTMTSSTTAAKWEGTSITTNAWALASGTTSTSVIANVYKNTVISGVEPFVPFSSALKLKGSGTEDDPYIISTAEDLMNLSAVANYNANYVASNYILRGKYFSQTADIDMSSISNFEPIAMLSTKYFGGIYNGNGHKITNLTVNQTKGTSYYSGLFGNVRDGEIKNLIIENPSISSTSSYAGAAVGYLSSKLTNVTITGADMQVPSSMYAGGAVGYLVAPGKVENVKTSGYITANDYAGGVVGNSPGGKIIACISNMSVVRAPSTQATPRFGGIVGSAVRDTMQIVDCAFYGNISLIGNEIAGGIIGSFEKGSMTGCHFGGTIMHNYSSTSSAVVGGLAGIVKDARIYDCLSSGIVQSYVSPNVGGLAGTITQSVTTPATEVKRSLYTGTMMVNNAVRGNEITASETGNVVKENNYIDAQTSFNHGQGVNTSALTGASLPAGLSAEKWTAAEGYYPVLKALASERKAMLDRVPFFLASGDNVKSVKNGFTLGASEGVSWYLFHNNSYTIKGNGLAIDGNNVTHNATATCGDTIVALYGNDLFRMYPLVVVAKEFNGSGTESDPFIIASKADLDKMFATVDGILNDYTGTHFRITNDIDMAAADDSFRGYSVNGVAYAFNGTLDGQGHTIKNLKISAPSTSSAPGSFINYLGTQGVVKNLVIDGSCSFTGGMYAGAVVGYNAGKILNCINHADVTAIYRYAGGIVGVNTDSIGGCFNDGRIITDMYYGGGIAGANSGVINECQNAGCISAELAQGFNKNASDCSYAGGIAGLNTGSVTNSLNQGSINGAALVGGIVGDHSSTASYLLSGNINTGVIMSAANPLTIGAIAGRKTTSNSPTIKNNIYDKQLSHPAAVNNTSLDANEPMATPALTKGKAPEGFSSAIWKWEAGKYPVLNAFAEQPASQFFSAARVEFATSPREENRLDKRTDAKVVLPANGKATLRIGENYSIAGNVLSHITGSTAAIDTLVIADASYSLAVPMSASPKLLPNGDGSSANPWLITSGNEWNTVAMYALENRATFEGDYFKVGADLDFSTSGFMPICQDGTTYFEGNFNGNGKTLSGIVYKNEDATTGKYLGLFGMTGTNAEIYDLTLAANDTIIGYQFVGGVAGYGGGKIHGIVNKATVETMKMTAAGGIVGYGLPSAEVYDCVNYGSIKAFTTAGGGIMGTNEPGAKVHDCKNYGYVTSAGSTGGILGSTKVGVKNCSNFGEVYSSAGNAGGIVGYMWPTYTTDNIIANCENFGKVGVKGSAAGGIAGIFNTESKIINCANYAPITSATSFAGGIAGSFGSKLVVIDSCRNYGRISTSTFGAGGITGTTVTQSSVKNSKMTNVANYGNVSAGTYSAGGIAGVANNLAIIDHAFNYCDSVVAGTYQAGGIIGNGQAAISNVYNRAYIQGTYSLGGIVGYTGTSYYNECITNAVNTGNVKSTGTTAITGYRIGGILGYGRAEIENAINTGNVSGASSTAGIVGYPYKGTTAAPCYVKNAYSTGRVECTLSSEAAKCGMVFGSAAPDYTTFENCYYDNQMCGKTIYTCDAAKVAPLATAKLMALDLGNGFVTMAKSYPRVASMADSTIVMLATSPLVLADGENADNVITNFHAYSLDGEWSGDKFTMLNHGLVTWSNASTTDFTPITVKVGDYSRTIELKMATSSGINENVAEGEISSERYFTLDGIEAVSPDAGIYIKVITYANGTTRTEKVLINK